MDNRVAFTSIIDGPKNGKHYRLVLANESGGYSELKETGDASDPFYVAKSEIWFETREAANVVVQSRNKFELGLTPEEAMTIQLRSVAAGVSQ